MKNYKVRSNKLFLFFAIICINVVFTSYDHKYTDDENGSSKKAFVRSVITAPTATLTSSTGEILSIDCYRKTENQAKSSSNFSVEVTIKKENLKGSTKLTETLPEGFSATVIESQGASFIFIDQKITFIWKTLPAASEFKISYNINVAANISGMKTIEGIFYFVENDRTMKFVLPHTTINIIDPSVNQLLAANQKPTTPKVTPKPPVVDYYQIKKPKTKSTKKLAAGAINYKVQILALYQPDMQAQVQVPLTFDTITEPVTITLTQGFLQYSIGPFGTFDEATKHKEDMVSKGYPGSFIKAYMNKRRITIKEARALQEGK